MFGNHDPASYANIVRQCLENNKRPLAIFLGAGCPSSIVIGANGSTEPLIKNIEGITDIISDELKHCTENGNAFKAICTHFAEDGICSPNIEDFLSHIRSLKQVAGKGNVRGLTASDLEALDNAICKCIVDLVNKKLPSKGTPYHVLATWIGSIDRLAPVEIFTSNYDLLMEQALEECQVPFFDGFIGSSSPFFDVHAIEDDILPNRWARLWKIHGSINWRQDSKGCVFRGERAGTRLLIYPSHLKYNQSRRLPYFVMIDRMRAFLKRPSSTLIICGYSFRDEHINEVLMQGIHGNPSAMVFGLLFGSLANYSMAISLAESKPNLSLLAEDEAFIGMQRKIWSPIENTSAGLPVSTAIEWIQDAATNTAQPLFKLGNFVSFAKFLEELMGKPVKPEEQTID